MAFRYPDRVRHSMASAPGTGNVVLGQANQGYQTLAQAGVNNGDTFSYLLVDGTVWEYGVATYSSTGVYGTVTRTTITQTSANNQSPVNITSKGALTAVLRGEDIASNSTLGGLSDVGVTKASNIDGFFLYWNNTAGLFEVKSIPFVSCVFLGGTMANGETLVGLSMPYAVTIPAGAAGCAAVAGVAATASTTVTIKQNGTTVGTIVWAASGTIATITINVAVQLAQGDLLTLVAPATADTTLANISITLQGLRNS